MTIKGASATKAPMGARDPARIPALLVKLGVYWTANPDMRLAQLVWMLAAPKGGKDPFYVEDEAIDAQLDKLMSRPKRP